MTAPPRLPPLLREYLSARTAQPFFLSGPVTDSLRDPLSVPHMEELLRALRGLCESKAPITVESDGEPDAVAAAAIMLALCRKMGALLHPGGQMEIFGGRPAAGGGSVNAGGGTISVSSSHGRAAVSLSEYASSGSCCGLSLSGLALKVVDAAFILGGLRFPDDFIGFDFETTGRDPARDEIIEMGAVKVIGGSEAEVFSTFVKPRRPIPEEVVSITHITPEMVAGAPPAEQALERFMAFCGPLPLVAHNVAFDLAFFINQARLLLGVEIPNDTEDSLIMARWLYPEAPNHRLADVAGIVGVDIEGWHRAENDARAVAGIYMRLKDRNGAGLRDLRVKHYLDIAALGTLASGLPIEGENEAIVKHGLRMMLRRFSPYHRPGVPVPQGAAQPDDLPGMLLSLNDEERRLAALQLLSRLWAPTS